MDFRSPFGESLNHFLLVFCRLRHNVMVFYFRGRQVKLVSSFDVCHFFEKIHQLWKVKKF